MTEKLWGGRFTKTTDQLVEAFNASIQFDQRLYREDIRGSMAHARMLGKVGILTAEEVEAIVTGLAAIRAEIDAGTFEFSVALEDIHMNIEKRLTDRIGQAGAKLHTARSRNDQVALDMHLYMRRETGEIAVLLHELLEALTDVAEKHTDVILPGYTHLQRAQPVTLAHHLLTYCQMLTRDFRRLENVWVGADIMPLGAGALAGTTFPIDRKQVAAELNFGALYDNSMDAVSDRDYLLDFLSFASVLMMHLSRLSEEIILWSSAEFAFIELDDAYSTGSSMMPQKKNPDVAELVRGKTGRVYGHLMGLLTTAKGLPLAYNKDLQEDKEGVFDAIDTVKVALAVYRGMLTTMRVRRDKMLAAASGDFANATDLADYLVKKGLPFRQAHEVVGKAVRHAIDTKRLLADIPLGEYRVLSPLFEEDLLKAITIDECVNARRSLGGAAPQEAQRQIELLRIVLSSQKEKISAFEDKNKVLAE